VALLTAIAGNRMFSFAEDDVDFFLPQLLTLYVNMHDVAEATHPYIVYRFCAYLSLWGCGGGGAVSPVRVAPTRTVGTSASVIFPCSIKIQKTGGGETQPVHSTALC